MTPNATGSKTSIFHMGCGLVKAMKAWADEAIRRKHPSERRGSLLQEALIHMTSWHWIPAVGRIKTEKTYCIGDLWGEGTVNENLLFGNAEQ